MAASKFFSQAAQWISRQCGRAPTFGLAVLVVVVWGATGPIFQYSDTWQLVINTGTTIVTFLMVFLIQNTQNRDTAAIQLKLDELIRVTGTARNKLLTIEDLTEEELDRLKAGFSRIARKGGARGADAGEAERDLEEIAGGIEKTKTRTPSRKPRKKVPAEA
ncbi:MAG TPA: low affinity iron permease family protein [Stellaceae bacterium]|nr:low affinity iron permease family protein [Stellaceae bacterium]